MGSPEAAYNFMRAFEEVSKTQDPELMHPSDKKYTKMLEKIDQVTKKRAVLLTGCFSVKNRTHKLLYDSGRSKCNNDWKVRGVGYERACHSISHMSMKNRGALMVKIATWVIVF